MHYWNDEHEAAIIEYINSDNSIHRSRIFSTVLYEPLTTMATIILKRYFYSFTDDFTNEEKNDLISDAVAKCSTISTFTAEKGTAYSYYSASIKFHYYDVFEKITKNNKLVEFDLEQHDVELKEYELNDRFIELTANTIQFLLQKRNAAANQYLATTKSANNIRKVKNEVLVIDTLIEFFQKYYQFNSVLIALYLRRRTKLPDKTIKKIFSKHQLAIRFTPSKLDKEMKNYKGELSTNDINSDEFHHLISIYDKKKYKINQKYEKQRTKQSNSGRSI